MQTALHPAAGLSAARAATAIPCGPCRRSSAGKSASMEEFWRLYVESRLERNTARKYRSLWSKHIAGRLGAMELRRSTRIPAGVRQPGGFGLRTPGWHTLVRSRLARLAIACLAASVPGYRHRHDHKDHDRQRWQAQDQTDL